MFALRVRGCPVTGEIRRTCEPFLVEEPAAFGLDVDFLDSTRSAQAHAAGMFPEHPRMKMSAQQYSLAAEFFHSDLDWAVGAGRITIACSPWPLQAFNSALLGMLQHVLLRRGDILLHACAVEKNGRAYVFCGASEAGKSTVARCSSVDCCILSQEIVGIKEEQGVWQAYALPYSDDARFPRRSNRPFPLAGLYCLVKDTAHALVPLSSAQALAGLFTLPPGVFSASPCESLLACFGRLVGAVDCFALHFLPDNSFWRSIEEYEKVSAAV